MSIRLLAAGIGTTGAAVGALPAGASAALDLKSLLGSTTTRNSISMTRTGWIPSGQAKGAVRDDTQPVPSVDSARGTGGGPVTTAKAADVPSKPPKKKGDRLGPFDIQDLAGHRWTDRQLKGKTVIAVVWDIRCGFCHPMLPDFQKFYEHFRHDGRFVIISFSLNDDVENLAAFVREKRYSFPVLPAHDLLQGSAVPSTWICDRDGVIRRDIRGWWSEKDESWAQEVLAAAQALER
jgi:peroxiredoxin